MKDSDYIKIISDSVDKECLERTGVRQSQETRAVIEVFAKILLGVADVEAEFDARLDRVEQALAVLALARLRESGIDVEKLFADARAATADVIGGTFPAGVR
jgi:hypothetical protein